jgi:signal transduction histidine kinase
MIARVVGRLRRGEAAPSRPPRRRGNLFRRYAAVCVALVGGALLVSGGIQVYFSYRENREAQGRVQREKAALAAAGIEHFLRETEHQIASVIPPPGLAASYTIEQRQADYQRLLRQSSAITELRYLDAGGTERLFSSRLVVRLSGEVNDGVSHEGLAAARSGQVWFSPVEFRHQSEPHMVIAIGEGGLDGGVIAADVNLTLIWDVVSRTRVGKSGTAYVVDSDGRLIAHPDISLVLRQTDLSSLPQVRAARADAATPGSSRPARSARDPRGRSVLTASEVIDPPGWYVFADVPLNEAFAPVYASVLRTTVFLLAGLGLSVLAALMLARRMAAPIQALQAGAARIAAGSLDQHIEARTGDEIEALADEFNHMTDRLRESYAGLEARVEQRTRALAKAMRELEERGRQLAAADRAKSDFLSRMSHELRTPLNAVIGFAEIMEMDPQTSPRQQERVRHILKGGRHLLGMINEVLDIARIEAGRLSLSPEPVAVDEVLPEVLDLVHQLATQRDIGLALHATPSPGLHVRADRQRLKQVLLNLLTNAVKYNHDGGRVSLSYAEHIDGRIRITVRDTGPGIPADKLDRLFTPFDRLGAELSGVEGTGLGLAITKRLVEAMGGTVGVESTVDAGSAFWVELPRVTGPLEQFQRDEDHALASRNGQAPDREATVLYIEDNLSNLRLVEHILAFRPGVKLLSAMQGGLGLSLAQAHRPDLVLLDLNLPDLQGDEVLGRLREDPRTSDIPVVVLSADATPKQIGRLLDAGARAYLTKPLDVKQLLDTLDAHL